MNRCSKERIARAFIQRVEQTLIPGLWKAVDVMEVGTPLTNLFYTRNPEGAIYGFGQNLPPLGARSPIKGLYLASAWSHGGGYTPAMMAGRRPRPFWQMFLPDPKPAASPPLFFPDLE